MHDFYLYDDCDVLKNLLGIKNQQQLEEAEADYVSMRLKELAVAPLPGHYSVQHYLRMHQYIFQDVFEWAGEFRKLNIEKEEDVLGGLSVEYSDIMDIAKDIMAILDRMNGRDWGSLSLDEKATAFSADVAALWKAHGFREGNTRTTITFCCQFADEHGFPIDRKLFEENSKYVRTALVAYNAVFHDLGDLSKKEYLERIIKDALSTED